MSEVLEAQQIVGAIDARIDKALGSAGRVQYISGVVAALDGSLYNVYLQGDTVASEGFRSKNGLVADVGDRVVVAIDKEKDDRWIEEVVFSGGMGSGSYPAMGIDVAGGQLRFSDGTTAHDVSLYRSGTERLEVSRNLGVGLSNAGGLAIGTSAAPPSVGIAFGADTSLARVGANDLAVGAGDTLRVGGAGAGNTAAGVSLAPTGSIEIANNGGIPYIDLKNDISGTDYDARIAYNQQGGDELGFYGSAFYYMDSYLYSKRSSASYGILAGAVTGDSNYRFTAAADGGLYWGSGSAAQDTNLYRSAANTLKTDDALTVTGLLTASGGISITDSGSDNTFSITGGGTATYTSKNCEWVKIGPLVVMRLYWQVNAAGSGTTALSIASGELNIPTPRSEVLLTGGRGSSGVYRICARLSGDAVTTIADLSSPNTGKTGADLGASSAWSLYGVYLTNE